MNAMDPDGQPLARSPEASNSETLRGFDVPKEAPALPAVPSAGRAPPAGSGRRVWIAWERQRRSLNLAARLDARLLLCIDEDKGVWRYPLSALRTLRELRRMRGGTVCVQNPSMVLAALACLCKPLFRYFLVVDRHSNFSHLAGARAGLKRRLSDLLSGFTLRGADITVVTNRELAAFVKAQGGRPFVLPDPFPDLSAYPKPGPLPGVPGQDRPAEILFVSSWAFDEPIAEAIQACRRLQGRIIVRITGRPNAAYKDLLARAPANFVCTGFVPDDAYFALMARSDAVIAVTRREATLVCGGYEAAVLGRPMVLGDSRALRDYFHLGAVYTDATPADLERKLESLLAELPRLGREVRLLLEVRGREWEERLRALEKLLPGR